MKPEHFSIDDTHQFDKIKEHETLHAHVFSVVEHDPHIMFHFILKNISRCNYYGNVYIMSIIGQDFLPKITHQIELMVFWCCSINLFISSHFLSRDFLNFSNSFCRQKMHSSIRTWWIQYFFLNMSFIIYPL